MFEDFGWGTVELGERDVADVLKVLHPRLGGIEPGCRQVADQIEKPGRHLELRSRLRFVAGVVTNPVAVPFAQLSKCLPEPAAGLGVEPDQTGSNLGVDQIRIKRPRNISSSSTISTLTDGLRTGRALWSLQCGLGGSGVQATQHLAGPAASFLELSLRLLGGRLACAANQVTSRHPFVLVDSQQTRLPHTSPCLIAFPCPGHLGCSIVSSPLVRPRCGRRSSWRGDLR